ncbi:MAG: exodeoxyribonuclease VII small subunit [Alphaproteobacteria bacterium]|jgi:exodeoxyribonuclease VII small subunit|nr:exodeoxyribonuclease VII small subunit [Alphaproteobacteria bacterium]MDG1882740.1 exodeoxyribonuclease VII small subunit [Alphaproteobacteria bacterium]MDG2457395.1 exodeoxyribonuclease VII small subunit [Alphaproteobacteria bacterium]|tara:strand:+ start:783 stop:1034 length:252 start_codon:yes stop_codon:yes gene_type:complete
MSNDNVIDTMTFEEAMNELEKLVESLDKGDISLDQAISAYDKGSQLKDLCQKKLNEAKMKVETIQSSDNSDVIPDKLTTFDSD